MGVRSPVLDDKDGLYHGWGWLCSHSGARAPVGEPNLAGSTLPKEQIIFFFLKKAVTCKSWSLNTGTKMIIYNWRSHPHTKAVFETPKTNWTNAEATAFARASLILLSDVTLPPNEAFKEQYFIIGLDHLFKIKHKNIHFVYIDIARILFSASFFGFNLSFPLLCNYKWSSHSLLIKLDKVLRRYQTLLW